MSLGKETERKLKEILDKKKLSINMLKGKLKDVIKDKKYLETLIDAYNERAPQINGLVESYETAIKARKESAEKNIFVKAFSENIEKFDNVKKKIKQMLNAKNSALEKVLEELKAAEENLAKKSDISIEEEKKLKMQLAEAKKKFAMANKQAKKIMPAILKKFKKHSLDAKKIAAKYKIFKDKTLSNALCSEEKKGIGCIGVLNEVYALSEKNEKSITRKEINVLLKKLTAKNFPKGYEQSRILLQKAQNVDESQQSSDENKLVVAVKTLEKGCEEYEKTLKSAEQKVATELKNQKTLMLDSNSIKNLKLAKTKFKTAFKGLFLNFGAKEFKNAVKVAISEGGKENKTAIQNLAEVMRLAVLGDHLSPPTSLLSVIGTGVASGGFIAISIFIIFNAAIF
ncbi:MAG: hypothetical protein LBJ32_01225, partial [Oscillospiraceae bacterium]|nr:hypothetical protein [Oscillospiraceae bacterium]